MAFVHEPDIDDYLARITAIQLAIIPDSKGAAANPTSASISMPYWLNLASAVVPPRDEAAFIYTATYQMIMILVRSGRASAYQPQIEANIMRDLFEVQRQFSADINYKNFIVGDYNAIQPGFIPNTARIMRAERIDAPQIAGGILGSAYTLQWQHRFRNDY